MKSLLIASMLVFGLVGCATQPETRSLDERQNLKVDPEVIYTTKVTELFEERKAQPGGGSLLQVQFAVEARSDTELAWKVTWFKDNGMVVKGVGEGYRKASLLTGQVRYFNAIAPNARVTRYQLHLREPR